MSTTSIDALVGLIGQARDTALPDTVCEHTSRVLFDGCAAMIAATSSEFDLRERLRRYADRTARAGVATALTGLERTDVETAALLNGAFAYYCDSEPHHPGAILHAFATVAPAALAVAEAEGVSGRQLLQATAVGVDVACRISYGLSATALYQRGFHPTSVAGTFGAAAAACVLHRLGDREIRHAFGLAGTQASGTLSWVTDDTEHSRPLNPGFAARQGVLAAALAASGLGGPPDILEGSYPAWNAFSGEWHPDSVTGGLGERWLITELWFKRHACCAFLHPGVDGLLDIVAREGIKPDAVRAIHLRFPSSGSRVIDGNPLRSHCAQYVLPVAAATGEVRFQNIVRDVREHDARVAALADVTTLSGDDELDRTFPDQYRSIVHVTTDDGVHERDVLYPRGAPEAPLSDAELLDKAHRITADVADAPNMARLQQLAGALVDAENVHPFTDALVGRALNPEDPRRPSASRGGAT